MKSVSLSWKRFAGVLVLGLLATCAPRARAQGTATLQFGPVPDVLVGETFEVPVVARRLQQTRAVRVQVVTRGDRVQWSDVTAGEGADGMEVVDWTVRGDTLDVVLSHLDPQAETTLLRSEPILKLQGERTGGGVLPLSFADVPVAVVARDLSVQDVAYGEATATALAPADAPQASFTLLGNHPNPFRGETAIALNVATAVDATLIVYDLLGRQVYRSAFGRVGPGMAVLTYSDPSAPAGQYLYRVRLERPAGEQNLYGTMTLVR